MPDRQTDTTQAGRQAGRQTQQQAKTFVTAYPEACAYDSKPQEGSCPARIVCVEHQRRHHIDYAMPTAVHRAVLSTEPMTGDSM